MNNGRVGTSWKGPKLNEPRKRFVIGRVDGYEVGVFDLVKVGAGFIGVYLWIVIMLSL